MAKIKISIVICLVLLMYASILIYGCATNTSTTPELNETYYPHTNGNRWVYSSTTQNNAQIRIGDITVPVSSEFTSSEEAIFDGTEELAGIGTSQLYKTWENGTLTGSTRVIANASGVKYYGNEGDVSTAETYTILVFPGGSWTASASPQTTATVIGKEPVTIGSTTYSDCYKVLYSYTSSEIFSYPPYNFSYNASVNSYVWFAKNVGAVKRMSTSTGSTTATGYSSVTLSVSNTTTQTLTSKNF